MALQRTAGKNQCERCVNAYTSVMRLQHHRAAEHAPKTLKDIRTKKDIRTLRNLPHTG